MKICICGGGSLGHVCAGVLSSQVDNEVSVLSEHPQKWGNEILVEDCYGKEYKGRLSKVSKVPEEVVKNKDIVLLCLPGYLIEDTLVKIKPFIGNAKVGSIVSSTGFFFFARKVLDEDAVLFGFQRVPYIARVKEYGKSASLLGYKKELAIGVRNTEDSIETVLGKLFGTPVSKLNSFYEAALTNSNPILHPARLYSMFKGKEDEYFDHQGLFYKEWTDEASETAIKMDEEFFLLLDKLGIKTLPTLLDYYESCDAESLTRKMRSIVAFERILSPMILTENGWKADITSRYFIEDFPFGLRWIRDLAKENEVETPIIDEVYEWGISMIPEYKCFLK